MAAVFDLDTERTARLGGTCELLQAFELIVASARRLDPHLRLDLARTFKAQSSALEADALAEITKATGDDRAAKKALQDGKTSKTAIKRAIKRGAAAAANPGLLDKAANGMSEEQFDVIADTADKTDGAAAVDDDFINDVAAVDPDQAKAVAAKFIQDRADKDKVQSEHDRQRRLRRAFRYISRKDGTHAITIAGDQVAITNMWDAISARGNEIYRADGSRDVQAGKHPRSSDQRKFDAAHELICGVTTTPSGTINQPRGSTSTDDRATQGREKKARIPTKTAPPQIFVVMTLDKYVGNDPKALAEQIGLGLIPDSVLADYLGHGQIIPMLFDRHGRPLWLGRLERHAGMYQRFALIARDKGCVLCGGPHQQCEAHHLLPWEAPAKGETNIDNLALLCGPCHRRLHADNRTLYRDDRRRWRTRAALPHETPPKRVEHPRRE